MADLELALVTLRLAMDAAEDCLDTVEAHDRKLAYVEATRMATQLTERVRRLRYELRT